MTEIQTLIGEGEPAEGPRPFHRVRVTEETWLKAIDALAVGSCSLLGLWATPGSVHLALLEETEIAVLSLDCPDGRFPSVGARHAPAIRPERAVADLYGLDPSAVTTRGRGSTMGGGG